MGEFVSICLIEKISFYFRGVTRFEWLWNKCCLLTGYPVLYSFLELCTQAGFFFLVIRFSEKLLILFQYHYMLVEKTRIVTYSAFLTVSYMRSRLSHSLSFCFSFVWQLLCIWTSDAIEFWCFCTHILTCNSFPCERQEKKYVTIRWIIREKKSI